MPALFKLSICTPEKTVFDAESSSLCVPEDSGYLGVLAHHAPLICTLVPGKVTFKDKLGKLNTMRSTGQGLLEVLNNQVNVLLDSVA
jgi:F-type H+-transporting ATPase subunit epsilon